MYRVFARKYRPNSLSDLIGQEVVVQTLRQIFQNNRIPHAFLFHGIRGVGKTTLARILANGMNCGMGPTLDPCGICASCLRFKDDRHLDIVEIDAASRTGVDDIREVIEATRYKPVHGRYKIFIIDEVHMLSKSAFNALLKTLEEPPPHAKFIFATTELKKIPDTVRSRCVLFDLKRIPPTTQILYMKKILSEEDLRYEDEALSLIARVSEGSMRDALGLLDQVVSLSFSQGDPTVSASLIRSLLGVSDPDLMHQFFEALIEGDISFLLKHVRDVLENGADPLLWMQDILLKLYKLICHKMAPHDDPLDTPEERTWMTSLVEKRPPSAWLRSWQILLKGYDQIERSPLPSQTLEMVLVRLCFLKDLPPIETLISQTSPSFSPPKIPTTSFEEAVHKIRHHLREPLLASQIERWVSVVSYDQGHLVAALSPESPEVFLTQFKKALESLTQSPWVIDIQSQKSGTTLREHRSQQAEDMLQNMMQSPTVLKILERFPESCASLSTDFSSKSLH